MEPEFTTAEQFIEDLEAGKIPVVIGLRAQGHIPTVEKMLEEGSSWAEIGKAIGWDGDTAKEWYGYELNSKSPTPH
jgi:hypothetical protein